MRYSSSAFAHERTCSWISSSVSSFVKFGNSHDPPFFLIYLDIPFDSWINIRRSRYVHDSDFTWSISRNSHFVSIWCWKYISNPLWIACPIRNDGFVSSSNWYSIYFILKLRGFLRYCAIAEYERCLTGNPPFAMNSETIGDICMEKYYL